MSATAAFAEQLDALGIWWPRGDGDALRSAAQAWRAMADYLEDTTATLDHAATRVRDDHEGASAEAFAALWREWSIEPGHLARTVADCRRLVVALIDFASDIDAADRTIVQLIELALDSLTASGSGGSTLLDLDEAWRRWLDDAIRSVGMGLAAGADRTAAAARSVDDSMAPRTPHGVERGTTVGDPAGTIVFPGVDPVDIDPLTMAAGGGPVVVAGTAGPTGDEADPIVDLDLVDPDEIDWVDPGTPDDLSHLAVGVVDFGAGQGDVPDVGAPSPAPDPGSTPTPIDPTSWPIDPVTGVPIVPPGWPTMNADGDDDPVTINVNGDGAVVNVGDDNTVTVTAPTTTGPSGVPSIVPPPAALEPPTDPPADSIVDPAALAPPPIPVGGGSGGGFGVGGVGAGGGFSGGGTIDLAPIDGPTTDYEAFELTDPTDGSFVEALDAPPATVLPPTEAATASGGRNRMPFFPMMPMGMGGAGGDDGNEPRRKRMRP